MILFEYFKVEELFNIVTDENVDTTRYMRIRPLSNYLFSCEKTGYKTGHKVASSLVFEPRIRICVSGMVASRMI